MGWLMGVVQSVKHLQKVKIAGMAVYSSQLKSQRGEIETEATMVLLASQPGLLSEP